MPVPTQEIRFCRSRDGVRLAYAISGSGPPLVKAGNWVTHIEMDWESPVWRPWLLGVSRGHTLIRYDFRGCGLSDQTNISFSFEKLVDDLEAVVEAARLDRFALLGLAGGGAIAMAYAVRHPTRVSHLVLYGSFSRGRIARSDSPAQLEEARTLIRLVEMGSGKDDSAFRQLFTSQFIPGGTTEQFHAFNALMRAAAPPANAARVLQVLHEADLQETAARVKCPTLVMHPSKNFRVPFEEGRELAALIPGAKLVPLDSQNFILLEGEPAWDQFTAELDSFLPRSTATSRSENFDELTARERTVVELVAQGLDNRNIATALLISEKTVRNHVSTTMSKLGISTRSQLIVRAREAGYGRMASP